MSKKENKLDISTPEARELIKRYAESAQRLDNQIKQLQDEKTDVFKQAKDEGLSSTILRKVISEIRKEQEKTPDVVFEEDVYFEILNNAGIIQSLK
jgi:uncharacterized protein (UPF0335 family)